MLECKEQEVWPSPVHAECIDRHRDMVGLRNTFVSRLYRKPRTSYSYLCRQSPYLDDPNFQPAHNHGRIALYPHLQVVDPSPILSYNKDLPISHYCDLAEAHTGRNTPLSHQKALYPAAGHGRPRLVVRADNQDTRIGHHIAQEADRQY